VAECPPVRSRAPQRLDDDAWNMKTKIQGEHLDGMNHLVSDVKRDQRQTSRPQDAESLLRRRVVGLQELDVAGDRHIWTWGLSGFWAGLWHGLMSCPN
jgi:hypothetical protein